MGTTLENAKNSACNALLSANCFPSTTDILVEGFDADKDGDVDTDDNLLALCQNYFGIATDEKCKEFCGCTGLPVGGGGGGGIGAGVTQCNDGIDNDGDGAVDLDDPGCTDEADNSECGLENEACSVDSDCCTGLFCSSGVCVSCSCDSWQDIGCGSGGCLSNQMYQTRTCNPPNCNIEEQCVDDPSCAPMSGAMIEYKINPGIGTNNFIAMNCYDYDSSSWTRNLVFKSNENRISHENVTIPPGCLNGLILMTRWGLKKDVANRPYFYEEKLWRLQAGLYIEDDTEDSYVWSTTNVINPENAVDENWNSYSEYDEGFAILRFLYINYTLISMCSDGTLYGSCSATQPKYCDAGVLVDRCDLCGCPTGYECQSDGTCSPTQLYELKVEAQVDILGLPLENVNIVVDTQSKPTNSKGISTFFLTPGNYQLSVPNRIGSRGFTHFWDHNCSENTGNWLDDPSNPYPFEMFGHNKTITAWYKVLTQITDLNYDGSTIRGKLLDENNNPLIQQGGYHPTCTPPDVSNIVPVDRDIKLEYYDGSWNLIDTNPKFYDDFNDNDYDGWIVARGDWDILTGELNTSGIGDESIQIRWSG
jgi:hypothetical protein